MVERDGDWSQATHVTATHPDRAAEVEQARRSAASFGGGGPRLGDSVREFVRRYGWRAYALPVLLVVTVVALFTTATGKSDKPAPTKQAADNKPAPAIPVAPSSKVSSPPVAPSSIPLKSDSPGSGAYKNALKVGALPSGANYAKAGDGTYRVLTVPGGQSKTVGSGPLFRYDIEVENGVTGINVTQFANMVQKTLADPRSWSGHGVSLQRVDSGEIDFRISLTSSLTVRQYCGYDIPVETSCYAAAGSAAGLYVNRVVLNDARWVRGAAPYVGDLNAYRIYMINHEDGHAMGHQHAHECLPDGQAPVMMQQTFGLKSAATGKYCTANPWPYPPGAKGAPGVEAQDTKQNNEYYIGD